MRRVRWSAESIEDLERLQAFLIRENPPAATVAVKRILEAANHLETFPSAGKVLDTDSGVREWYASFGSGSYVFRYRLDADQNPFILSVSHSRETRH